MRKATESTVIAEKEETQLLNDGVSQPRSILTNQSFWENQRLVPFNTPASQVAHKYLEGITKELLGDRHDFDAEPIDFVIMDQKEINGFFLQKGNAGNKNHIIAISKGLIEACDNEDELAYVLGHEATHLLVKTRVGETASSKGEESISDINSIELLYEIGRNPQAAATMIEKIGGSEVNVKPDFARIMNEHPLTKNRSITTKDVLAGLNAKYGDLPNIKSKDFPDGIKEEFSASSHTSYFEALVQESGFEEMEVEERYDFILNHIDEVFVRENGNKNNKLVVAVRVNELANCIKDTRSLNHNQHGYDTLTRIDELDEKNILEINASEQRFQKELIKRYVAVAGENTDSVNEAEAVLHFMKLYPNQKEFKIRDFDDIPQISSLNEGIKSFISSSSLDEALSNAKNLNSLRDAIRSPQSSYQHWPRIIDYKYDDVLRYFSWDGFELPDKDNAVGQTVPWNDFVEWANQSDDIRSTLTEKLGVRDFRIEVPDRHFNHLTNPKAPSYGEVEGKNYYVGIDFETGVIENVFDDYYDWSARCNEVIKNTIVQEEFKKQLDAADEAVNSFLNMTFNDDEYNGNDISTYLALAEKSKSITSSNSRLETIYQSLPYDAKKYMENLSEADRSREALKAFIGEENHARLINFDKNLDDEVFDKYLRLLENALKNKERLYCDPYVLVKKGNPMADSCLSEEQHSKLNDFVLKEHIDDFSSETILDYYKDRGLHILELRKISNDKQSSNSETANAYEFIYLNEIREKLGYSEPNTADELVSVLEKSNSGELSNHQRFTWEIMSLETFLYMSSKAQDTKLPLNSLNLKFPDRAVFDELNLTKHFEPFILDKDNWPETLEEKITLFTNLKTAALFDKDTEAFAETAQWLINDIDKQPIEERIKLSHTLLKKHNRIANLEIRERITEMWTNAIFEQHGKDDGSTEYRNVIAPYAESIKKDAALGDQIAILNKLSTKLVSQQKLADDLTLKASLSANNLVKSQVFGVGFELAMDKVDRHPEAAKKVIDFFSSVSTTQSCAELRDYFNLEEEDSKRNDSKNLKQFKTKTHPSDFDNMHKEFWAAPLELRAVAMDRTMISANEGKDNWEDTFKLIEDKFIDKDDPNSQVASDLLHSYIKAREDYERVLMLAGMVSSSQPEIGGGRPSPGKALKNFLEIMDPATVKLGQAAHSHPNTPQYIKNDLDGIKGDANKPSRKEIHDWIEKEVPEEVRNEIADDGIGEILGSGSYFVTVGITKKDGSESVLSLLRPNARGRADNGFKVLQQTAKNFIERARNDEERQQYTEISSSIDQMIVQAKKMSSIEASCNHHGINQVKDAHKLYDSLDVTVGEYSFEFNTMAWKSYAKNYKEMEKAKGVSFNKLPENTEEEQKFKKSFAKGYAAVEFINILRGGKFDHDKHGEQLNIDVNGKKGTVGIYDTGAMAIKEPTKKEKRALGKAIGSAIKAGTKGGSPVKVFDGHIRAMVENNQDPAYLVEAKKAILALGDFTSKIIDQEDGIVKNPFRENKNKGMFGKAYSNGVKTAKLLMGKEKLDINEDLKHIVSLAMENNLIDKEIQKGIKSSVGTIRAIIMSKNLNDTGNITIKRKEAREIPEAKDLTSKVNYDERDASTIFDKLTGSNDVPAPKQLSAKAHDEAFATHPEMLTCSHEFGEGIQIADAYFIKDVASDR